MLHECTRRPLAAAVLQLLFITPHQIIASSITKTPQAAPTSNSPSTCEFRTINYITDTLPQLCFKSAWTPSASPTAAREAPDTDVKIFAGTSLGSEASKADQDVVQVMQANASMASEPTLSAPELSATVAVEEESSELNEAAFLSFEEWKKQALEKAGQKDANIVGKKPGHVAEQRKREAESNQGTNSFGPMGEEEELDLDFSAFREPGKGQDTAQDIEAQDSQRVETTEEKEKGRKKDHYRSKDAGKTCKERFSYASFDAGATILKTHSGAKNSKAVLIENKDSYMLSECSAQNKFIIIELSEDIWIDTVVLANYEFFSSMIRTFRISVSDRYPVKIEKWKDAGTYEARNSREIQAFLVENPQIWARYLRIEFLTHYGNEYYCPLSLVRVHGTRMLESWKESEATGEDEDAEDSEEGQGETEYVPDAVADVVKEQERINAELRAAVEEIVQNAHEAALENSRASEKATKDVTIWINPDFLTLYGHGILPENEVCVPAEAPISVFSIPSITPTFRSITSIQSPTTSLNSSVKTINSTTTSLMSGHPETASIQNVTVQIPVSIPPMASNITSFSSTQNTITTTPSPPGPPPSKVQNATASQRNKTSSTASAPSSLPTIQESFFKAVSRRLQLLETNSTLSLKYIEEQSKILREAFSKVEKKQLAKTTSFIETLNNTVLAELRGFRQQYDEIWQSTVISLESQREESQKEILAISARLNILADEVVFQKRMSIVQSILLLLCLVLVIFSRVSAAGQPDTPNVHNTVRGLSPETPLLSPSPPGSPEFHRTRSLRENERWLEPSHQRSQSGDSGVSRSRSSSYSRSENNLTPPSGSEEPTIRINEDLLELRPDHLEPPSTSNSKKSKRRRSGSSTWKESTSPSSTIQSSPSRRTPKKRKSSGLRQAQQPSPPPSRADDSTRESTPLRIQRSWSEDHWIEEEKIGTAISSPEPEVSLPRVEDKHLNIMRKPLPALPRNGE
ncbi:UNC-like C-terminal-domain-containing protein [Tricladium varicosporioides]|nr:UNC-like C-terminal-domain-containing protein [Hymenoscyphus varicosporioides]